MSTFQGIEMAKRAIFAQQSGLYTTGHNISNVNTPGYSRQRVNFQTTTPFPVPSRVQPQIPGQLGTGVEIGTVERIRDQFLDFQFRSENSRLGYWSEKSDALSRMEDLLNEPSETGLSKTMDDFWSSLEELSVNPENRGARSVVAQRGLAVAETFNHLSKSLQSIQRDLKQQIDVSVKDVNSLLRQINNINKQIRKIEPHGLLANDLYDDRDRLIDELSSMMNIKVHYTKSSDSSPDIADGLASIEVIQADGNAYDPPVYLIEANDPNLSLDEAVNELSVLPGDDSQGLITSISIGDYDLDDLELMDSIGALAGLIESHGFIENGEEIGDYPDMLTNLDNMAKEFAAAFNAVHESGVDTEGNEGGIFFLTNDNEPMTAENITINKDILDDPYLIAASVPGEGSRNGNNALKLAEVLDTDLANLNDTSVRKYFGALIGDLGVNAQEANRMRDNTDILQSQVNHERMAVSAVSLDEEISNLIKFQHAYNAAARNMTAIDETIDRIINNMGLVGR